MGYMQSVQKYYQGISNTYNVFDSSNKKQKRPNHTRCLNKFKNLLASKRNQLIRLVSIGDRKAFRVRKRAEDKEGGGKLYTGITRTLGKLFYPRALGESAAAQRKRRSTGGAHNGAKRLKSACKISGREHGTLVHRQIEEFTNALMGRLSYDHFLARNPEPDRCFLLFAEMCHNKGWVPVVSELPIFDEDLGIATGIDVLVLDSRTAEMILVEVKTSYESSCFGVHPSDRCMAFPLDRVPDCPLQRSFLQAVATCMILEKNYHVVPEQCIVVRICPKQRIIEIYHECPNWGKNKAIRGLLYDKLLNYNMERAAMRRKRRKTASVVM